MRHTADTITDDELDRLYSKIAVAEQAAAAERTFKWYADDAQRRVRIQRERAEQAEATIDRVRKHAEQWQAAMIPGERNPAAQQILDLLDEPSPAATEATELGTSVLRPQCEATVRMVLAGTGAHTVDEWAEYVTAAVLPIFTTRIDELRRERDQAIAHDRQPYPTAWAYEQACEALHAHRDRADQAEAAIKRVRVLLAGRWGKVDPDRVRDALDEQPGPAATEATEPRG